MKKIITPVFIALSVFSLLGCTQEGLFSKKENCKKYLSVMQDKVSIENEAGNQATEPIVFYSPSLDTCVGGYTVRGDSPAFYLYDTLTNENIFYTNPMLDKDGMNAYNKYEEKIDELKK